MCVGASGSSQLGKEYTGLRQVGDKWGFPFSLFGVLSVNPASKDIPHTVTNENFTLFSPTSSIRDSLTDHHYQVYSVTHNVPTFQVSDVSHINCMYFNATSLHQSKLAELSIISETSSPHIIFVVETWWTNTSIVNIANYNVHRKDRASICDKSGGGIAIYVRSDLSVSDSSLVSHHSEQLWLELNHNSEKILVGCIYRPQTEIQPAANLEIFNFLRKAHSLTKRFDSVLIAGDLNLPDLKWSTDNGVIFPSSTSLSPLSIDFLDAINDAHLCQLVTFPTYIDNGLLKNTLDYVLTDQPNRLTHLSSSSPLGSSNQKTHLSLCWSFKTKSPLTTVATSSTKFNYNSGDYVSFNNYICKQNWTTLFTGKCINDSYDIFINLYKSACENFIPKLSDRARKKYSPWINKDIRGMLQLKKSLFYRNVASKWNFPILVKEYMTIKKKLKKSIKSAILQYEHKLASDKKNPKILYKYINSKQNVSSAIHSLTTDGSTTNDRSSVALCLNNQFCSVFVDDSKDNSLPPFELRTISTLSDVYISPFS